MKNRIAPPSFPRTFRRVTEHSMFAGVCSGLAYWLAVPTWVVRLLWFISIWCFGVGLGAYVLLALFAPAWRDTPADYAAITGDD